MNKSILFKEVPELRQASDLLADNFKVRRFTPDILEQECYENRHSWAGSEGVLFYLTLPDKVIKVPAGGWYSQNGNITHCENRYLWESFISPDGAIDEKLIQDLICIFSYEWRDFNNNFEVPESIIFVRINKDALKKKLEEILEKERQNILNPEE